MTSLITIQITKPFPVRITMKYTGKNVKLFGAEEQEFLVVIPSQKNHPEYINSTHIRFLYWEMDNLKST